jgi:signal transduction histidine kinase/predicted transcriptional regulator
MFLKNFIKEINDVIDKDCTLQDAVSKMSKDKLHHIVIVENEKPIGIITEKDIIRLYKNNVDFSVPAIDYAVKNIITLHGSRLTEHALSIMVDNNIRKVIVTNSSKTYLGCVEQEDIVFRFGDDTQKAQVFIKELLNQNNESIILDGNLELKEALTIMTRSKLTSILVSKDNVPVGIISESDIINLAKEHIDHKKSIENFMHTPLVTINKDYFVNDMINLMREKNIRRVVVFDDKDDKYHTLNSKDLVNNIKGNYTAFLESKLFDARDTFNALLEYVIELIDLDDEQVIFWTNGITKIDFDVGIDDNITKIIPKYIWEKILNKLITERIVYETIKIGDRYLQLKGHYGTILGDDIIKLFLNDITEITKLNNDLKEQNFLQQELLFSQAKMAQMGEMIGNIAHQWRQPLSTISTSASGIELEDEYGTLSKEQLKKFTNLIIEQSDYLSKTIDTFRNFIKEKKELKRLHLQERIDIALNIVTTTLHNKHINIINEIDYNTSIYYDMVAGEIEQVIINIINNSKDALLEKNIDNPWVKISLNIDEKSLFICIEDNAGGIPENILPNVFNQYFTTKDESTGTGLGLFMSKKIIEESFNGEIFAENTESGAKFYIKIPYLN